MKNIQESVVRSLLVVLLIAIGAGRTLAFDHDDKGWIDDKHQHHPFIHHNGHRGYWDKDKTGAKIFISV